MRFARAAETFGLYLGEKLGKCECTANEIREISSVSFGMAKKEVWPEKHVRRRARKNERADYEPLNFPKEFNYKTRPWYTAIVSIKMSEGITVRFVYLLIIIPLLIFPILPIAIA